VGLGQTVKDKVSEVPAVHLYPPMVTQFMAFVDGGSFLVHLCTAVLELVVVGVNCSSCLGVDRHTCIQCVSSCFTLNRRARP